MHRYICIYVDILDYIYIYILSTYIYVFLYIFYIYLYIFLNKIYIKFYIKFNNVDSKATYFNENCCTM